ncbi:MAG: NAD-dependent epimerase/dehydratase family protein, partial [Candidatus Blackburnbacteria bacterium]|nr:NAD-dependent epimerase/dehydratase family protein [Candidatus Blackburnbacteria bacterium]
MLPKTLDEQEEGENIRIAVTGSQGFLGRWVIKVLNEVGIENRGLDISGNGDHIQVDLGIYSHTRSALAEIKPDAVIHLAALAGASGKGGGAESLKA